jgi:hypothetical protein
MSLALKTIADALETAAGASASANDTRTGYWKRIATALETGVGASSSANENLLGYMLRAAIAAEAAWGGSGAEENVNYPGLLKRVVDAMELSVGVGSGSLDNRLLTGAPLVSFSPASTLANLAAANTGLFWNGADLTSMWPTNTAPTINSVDTDPVGRWDDTRVSYDLKQDTAASLPVVNTVSGIRRIAFDWVDDNLTAQNAATMRAASMTLAIACRRTSGTARADIMACGNAAAFGTVNWIMSLSTTLDVFPRTPASKLTGPVLPAAGTDMVLFVQCDGANVSMQIDKGTATTTAGTFGTDNTTDMSVGASIASGSPGQFTPATVHGVLVLPAVLSTADRNRAITALAALQGRTI